MDSERSSGFRVEVASNSRTLIDGLWNQVGSLLSQLDRSNSRLSSRVVLSTLVVLTGVLVGCSQVQAKGCDIEIAGLTEVKACAVIEEDGDSRILPLQEANLIGSEYEDSARQFLEDIDASQEAIDAVMSSVFITNLSDVRLLCEHRKNSSHCDKVGGFMTYTADGEHVVFLSKVDDIKEESGLEITPEIYLWHEIIHFLQGEYNNLEGKIAFMVSNDLSRCIVVGKEDWTAEGYKFQLDEDGNIKSREVDVWENNYSEIYAQLLSNIESMRLRGLYSYDYRYLDARTWEVMKVVANNDELFDELVASRNDFMEFVELLGKVIVEIDNEELTISRDEMRTIGMSFVYYHSIWDNDYYTTYLLGGELSDEFVGLGAVEVCLQIEMSD
jgi:hypothetical protein